MKKTVTKAKEKIYTIFFKNKWWHEKDVDDIFAAFYHGWFTLGFESSVYVGDGMRICPDGTCING